MPLMTAAMPMPNATTSTRPNVGRPAAIAPSRISNALVDGMRPPANPRTNRLRHVTLDAGRAGVRADGHGRDHGRDPRSRGRGLAGVGVVSGVGMPMVLAGACAGSSSADLAKEHPAADQHDRHGGNQWRPADDDVRGDHIACREHDGRERQDAYRGDRLTAAPRPSA